MQKERLVTVVSNCFLSSILASLGAVFGQNNQQEREEEELEMASITTTVEDRNRNPRGMGKQKKWTGRRKESSCS